MKISSKTENWTNKVLGFKKRIENLEAYIVPPFCVEEARKILAGIKGDLRAESAWATKRLKENPTNTERDYCLMIKQVAAYLKVPVNTNPCNGRWQSELAYVMVDLDYFLAECN